MRHKSHDQPFCQELPQVKMNDSIFIIARKQRRHGNHELGIIIPYCPQIAEYRLPKLFCRYCQQENAREYIFLVQANPGKPRHSAKLDINGLVSPANKCGQLPAEHPCIRTCNYYVRIRFSTVAPYRPLKLLNVLNFVNKNEKM